MLFALAFLAIILLADIGCMPPFLASLYSFPYGDVLGHFLLVGALAFLVNLGLSNKTVILRSKKILLGSLLLAVLMTLEELAQLFFPARTFSLLDLAASYLGILIFSWLAMKVKKSSAGFE